jgi:hypothetical protein
MPDNDRIAGSWKCEYVEAMGLQNLRDEVRTLSYTIVLG